MRMKLVLLVVMTLLSFVGCGNQEVAGGKTPEEQRIEDLIGLQDRLKEVVDAGDISKCAGLEMEQYVVSCEVNILSSGAKNNDDIGVCDKASNVMIKERCVATVKNLK